MHRTRNIVIGLSLSLASVIVSLLLLELYLRATLEYEYELDANLSYDRRMDTVYFQRKFVESYSGAEEGSNLQSYDPYLGWDYNIKNGRVRGGLPLSLLPQEEAIWAGWEETIASTVVGTTSPESIAGIPSLKLEITDTTSGGSHVVFRSRTTPTGSFSEGDVASVGSLVNVTALQDMRLTMELRWKDSDGRVIRSDFATQGAVTEGFIELTLENVIAPTSADHVTLLLYLEGLATEHESGTAYVKTGVALVKASVLPVGWASDSAQQSYVNYLELDDPRKPPTQRVVTIGDSFTFGYDVADDETYSFYLETSLENSEVLNMGVTAYGIDQAVLKYLQYGSQYKPDVVILGVLPHDYLRAGLPFFSYSKPVFKYDEQTGSFQLTNIKTPPPSQVLAELERTIRPHKVYSLALLRNLLIRAYWQYINPAPREQYYQEMDLIIEHVLSELLESTRATDTKVLVVQIPHGNQFSDHQGAFERFKLNFARTEVFNLGGEQYEANRHLLAIYEKLGITYIDLQKEFRDRFPLEEVFQGFYFPEPETTRGHFTPRGNLETARIIKEKLEVLP